MDVLAVADVGRLVDPYRSQAERDWATYGPVILADELGEPIVYTIHEPMTFHLPGGRFTPDFLHLTSSGRVIMAEVKGSRRQKNYRDARSKLRAAAHLYPFFDWLECRQERGGGWTLERIG